MSYTNGLDKPSDYFNTILWTGDGTASQPQTGVGFQPDWVWIKTRSTTGGHNIFDSVRGATKILGSDNTNAESTNTDSLTSFDSDGFTLAGSGGTSFSGRTYAGWSWLAGGTASSNTDGSITSNVSASTTSGFSIVSYTGTGANATVGHGLNSAPEMIIVKNRIDAGLNWVTGCEYYSGWDYVIELNLTDAESNAGGAPTVFTTTPPTSSVYSVGTAANSNGSGDGIIAYCFHSVKGYSKIGKYTGNGSTDGTFIFTGMKPAFFMAKRTDTASQWILYDNKRQNNYNPQNERIYPNLSDTPGTGREIDFVSNGIKLRDNATDSSASNVSGATYIYMCFAENPFTTSTAVPTTAR